MTKPFKVLDHDAPRVAISLVEITKDKSGKRRRRSCGHRTVENIRGEEAFKIVNRALDEAEKAN